MDWLNAYTKKSLQALELENIQRQWKIAYLEDAVKFIKSQETEKVATEE